MHVAVLSSVNIFFAKQMIKVLGFLNCKVSLMVLICSFLGTCDDITLLHVAVASRQGLSVSRRCICVLSALTASCRACSLVC